MKQMKRLACLLLALMMAASFWSCASAGTGETTDALDPDESTTVPDESTTVPDETENGEKETEPSETIGFTPIVTKPNEAESADAETAQLRLRGLGSNWAGAFEQDNGCFAVAASVEELNALLESKLSGAELDVSAYDDAFFTENLLVLIPRSSNSGSVRYQANLTVDGDMVHIELDAQMPEISTSDMADWLILVALPRAEYEAMTITVPAAGGNSNTGTVTK